MSKRNTIAEMWAHFDRVDIAPEASDLQRDEMQRAFYAGASSVAPLFIREDTIEGMLEEVSRVLAELKTWKAIRDAKVRSR